jgi:two-component system CheB/CheR fusion protein
VGRPINDLKPNLDGVDLSGLTIRVIDTLAPHEANVKDAAGHRYLLRIRPYVTTDQKIDGASIVLLDIDTLARSGERRA